VNIVKSARIQKTFDVFENGSLDACVIHSMHVIFEIIWGNHVHTDYLLSRPAFVFPATRKCLLFLAVSSYSRLSPRAILIGLGLAYGTVGV